VLLIIIMMAATSMSSVRIIPQGFVGILLILGQYRQQLQPGFHLVIPMISQVIKVDIREQVLEIPRQEYISKDNAPVNIDAIIHFKVTDAERAQFAIADYHSGTTRLAQSSIRSIVGEMKLNDLLHGRHVLAAKLLERLEPDCSKWGVEIQRAEINNIDPAGPIKESMRESAYQGTDSSKKNEPSGKSEDKRPKTDDAIV